MIRNHHPRKNTCLHLFLQCFTLTTSRMSFLITSPKKSAPSETNFLHQIQLLALIPLSLKTLAKFWACHWWNCLKHHQQCTCQVLWTRSHSHHTPLWKPWHLLANHHEHHQHISYHWHCTTWSEDSHRQTSTEKAITWQNCFEKLPPYFSNLPFLSRILEIVVLHKFKGVGVGIKLKCMENKK